MTARCIAIVGRQKNEDPWEIITTYESFGGSEEKAIISARSAITRWMFILLDTELKIVRTNISSCSRDRNVNNKHLDLVF